ncbi:MAG TPA: efflux RND transporter periplasmic adaptor subunit [Terriglobales bacterium]
MTPREKRIAVVAALAGIALVFAILGVARWVPLTGRAAEVSAPVTMAYETAAAPGGMADQEHSSHTDNLPGVQLTPEEQSQIGLQTVEVRPRRLERTLLTVARVDEPETQLATISARISGRIDKLFVDYTGQSVRRGQPIALIYSPELVTAAEEYRLALESRTRLGAGAEAQAITGADELVAASRRRLELWGLTPQQIEEISKSSTPQIQLPIYSSASGIVTERKVIAGQYVNTGDVLYTLTDLSTVWVKAELYGPDLAAVRTRQKVEIISEALPKRLHGQVSFIDPQVNSQTRTTSVRIQVPNPGMRLRPGMFVQAKFVSPVTRETLSVPRSAVLDTGTRKIVYVAKAAGEFEGREVQLGPATDDQYPVLSGLRAGERVVAQGSFLVDSQTRITGGMTGLFGGSKEFEREQAPAPTALKFSFRSDPATPKGGTEATFYVTLTEASGKPVSDAQVRLALIMPAMPAMNMAEMRAEGPLSWNGSKYVGRVRVPTSGSWNVEIQASRSGQTLGTYRARLMVQ